MTAVPVRQVALLLCVVAVLAACTGADGSDEARGSQPAGPAAVLGSAAERTETRAEAAAFASDVLATAVELGPEDRAHWLAAHVTASTLAQVRDFLDRWVDQLGGGDALPGVTDPRVSLTTLDFVPRSERAVRTGLELTIALVQRVSRMPQGSEGASVYVRTDVVVRITAQGPLLVEVLQVGEIPPPTSGRFEIYPTADSP